MFLCPHELQRPLIPREAWAVEPPGSFFRCVVGLIDSGWNFYGSTHRNLRKPRAYSRAETRRYNAGLQLLPLERPGEGRPSGYCGFGGL